MSEHDTSEEVGSVSVHVTKWQIHLAVRNILANEMKLDPVAIRAEVQQEAHDLIKKEVIDYLEGKKWNQAGLDDWARRTMEAYKTMVEKEFREQVKIAVRELLQNQVEEVIRAVVRDCVHVQIGYRQVPVRIERAEAKC